MIKRSLAAMLCTSMLSTPLWAQDNMDKLTNMQKTDATFTFVDQGGERAEALRDIVQHINVPDGFEVSLYAVVPDARSMAMAPQGTVLFAGTSKDKMWSIVDRDRDRVLRIAMRRAEETTGGDLDRYLVELENRRDSPEWRRLLSEITVNESYLFRAPQQFAGDAVRRVAAHRCAAVRSNHDDITDPGGD